MTMSLKSILSLAEDFAHELPPMPPALKLPVGAELAGWIDHTLLKPEATANQVQKLCEEALHFRFATVCVNPANVPLAAKILQGSPILVCAVAGFPLGANLTDTKVIETRQVVEAGAGEVDMVINIGAMKSGDYEKVFEDVQATINAAGSVPVKVILEMCYLDLTEKIIGCLICKEAGARFVKTSTGFGPKGATAEDIRLMRRVVGPEMGVKAAGGIRTYQDAVLMIKAGADRLGASAGVSILKEIGVV